MPRALVPDEHPSSHGVFVLPEVALLVGRQGFVVERCRGKRVLHLGCVDEGLMEQRLTAGEHLHAKLLQVSAELWGMDRDADGLRVLERCGAEHLIHGDIEKLDTFPELCAREWDVIVLCEVLEHLNNPGLFLEKAQSLFSPATEMVISVPNALNVGNVWPALRRREVVHPDHNYWFSYRTLTTLLGKHTYDVREVYGYSFVDTALAPTHLLQKARARLSPSSTSSPGAPSDASADPRPTAARLAWNYARRLPDLLVRKVLRRLNPLLVAEGIIAVVRPAEGSAPEMPEQVDTS